MGRPFRNLDARTDAFVGRGDALASLRDAALKHPLLLVLGTAGAGKTRTTMELFARHGRELGPDGAWFVDLSEVTDEAGMLAAFAGALGITLGSDAGERVATAVAARRRAAFLVDDFEKIVGSAPALEAIVRAAPEARFIVTSREVLRIGEHRVELGPLASAEAVELFVARAGTTVSDDLRALCDELDGLPLAIELAASRARVLSPRQLRDQIHRRFDLLRREGGGRRATLRGAIDVSWELLSENERAVLAQCSVFRGPFTLAAAEAVVRAEGWVLDVIQSLAERSLVQVVAGEPVRYRFLESIRAYAREKLEGAAVEERHADHFRTATMTELDRENAIAAHRFYLAKGDVEAALQTLNALDRLLVWRGPTTLRLALLDAALAVPGGSNPTRALVFLRRAGALLEFGRAADACADRERARELAVGDREVEARVLESFGLGAWHGGDIAAARDYFERASAAFDDPGLRARTHVFLANAHYFLGAVDEARRLYQQASVSLRAAGDLRTLALAVANLGSLEHDLGNLDAARHGYLDALEIERQLGMRSDEGIAQMNLGHLALEAFDIDAARALYERSIEIQREVGNRRWHAITLGYLGLCHEIAGRRDEARDVYVEAIAKHDEDGDAVFGGLTRCWLARLQGARGSFEEAKSTLAAGRASIARGGATLFEHVATVCEASIAQAAGLPPVSVDDARKAISSEVRIALRMLESQRSASTALVVSNSGRRATMPDGTQFDLATRAPLRRLLLALVDVRLDRPGAALTLDDLVQHGWPGEKLVGTTGPDRAYAALSTLRKLGLRSVLVRRDDGYLLDPAVPLRRVED